MIDAFDLHQRFVGGAFTDAQRPHLGPLRAHVGNYLVGHLRPLFSVNLAQPQAERSHQQGSPFTISEHVFSILKRNKRPLK
ncbi:hypothetical protein D3C79_661320 [compost metagenome]